MQKLSELPYKRFIVVLLVAVSLGIATIPSPADSYTIIRHSISTPKITTLKTTNTVISKYRDFLITEAKKNNLSENDILTLEEIIFRESRWKANAVHLNKNGSRDYGIMEINNYWWNKYAIKHNLNYKTSWKDNIKLGITIYKVRGSRSWTSMRKI